MTNRIVNKRCVAGKHQKQDNRKDDDAQSANNIEYGVFPFCSVVQRFISHIYILHDAEENVMSIIEFDPYWGYNEISQKNTNSQDKEDKREGEVCTRRNGVNSLLRFSS